MSAEPPVRPPPIECLDCALGQASGGPEHCVFRIHRFSDGEALMAAGDVPLQVIHVKSAVVELSAANIHGVEQRYSLRGPGAVLGWEALRDVPLSSDVRLLHGGEVCTVAVDVLRRATGTGFAPALLSALLDELALVQCELTLSAQRAAARVARYLLADISCVTGELNGRTARSIARQLGIRHETLSRVLHKLKAAGIVKGPSPEVVDPAALRRVVRTGHV